MPTAYENDLRSHDASLGAPAGRPETVTAGKEDDPVTVDGVGASVLARQTTHTSMHLVADVAVQGSMAAAARVAAWTDTPRRVARSRPTAQRPHMVCYQTEYQYPTGRGRGHRARRRLERSLRRVPGACYRPRSRIGWSRTKRMRSCGQARPPRRFSPGPFQFEPAAPATRFHRMSCFIFLFFF